MCLCDDVKGMLSLYEASYLGFEGKDFLDEVKAFTTKHLKALKGSTINSTLAKKVVHSLEVPFHWRSPKLEARWYIDIYEGENSMVPMLLDLAKLNYNIDQATYTSEIQNLARWWIGMGMVHERQFGLAREGLTQLFALITVIDDIYDIYGTLEELELFTNVVESFGVNPPMLSNLGVNPLALSNPLNWLHAGYTPTLKEYLENAVVSIGGPFVLVSAYLLTAGKITKEALDYIESMPSLIYNSSMLTRLANDLGTSSRIGDNPKSIQCYMHEKGVSEEAARDHINYPFLDEPFISSAPNLGRQSQCIYQYGDGHGIPDQETKDSIKSLFIEPIPLGKI
ncbi:hypothetical protein AQUCO_03900078v1 [Aquilegia coerulea]|uniref:Terpene synthase metal-binding domain-containing protein n=1 Tax=Aquilegia coerulea TaxID=218851 RepID=A0A2G5CSW7_AQUCA|nr:hypothetical protein AQUCO_03900078v1 [Aquilegia coerulea]